jgi:hypothetical protein
VGGCRRSSSGVEADPAQSLPTGARVEISGQLAAELREDLRRALEHFETERSTWPPEAPAHLLAEAGYLGASLCRDPDSLWMIRPGERVRRLDLLWRVPTAPGALSEGCDLPIRLSLGESSLSEQIEQLAKRALRIYDDRGYPLASLALREFTADTVLSLEMHLDPGPLVRVRDLRFEGRVATRVSFLRRVAGWRGPETYRGARWRDAREKLAATGLFDQVTGPVVVVQSRSGSSGRDGSAVEMGSRQVPDTLDVHLLYRLQERRVSNVRGLLGYSGQRETLAGFVDLELGNLFGTGRATRLFWQHQGEDQALFEFDWHEPFIWKLPLGLDLSLSHLVEDTLYARTVWGGDLLWSPTAHSTIRIGWDWERVVLGGEVAGSISRTMALFGFQRWLPETDRRLKGWGLGGEVATSSGAGPSLQRAELRAAAWLARGSYGLWLAQDVGLLGGGDTFMRSDVFRVGGAGSLRGYFEGEYRALAYLVQHVEVGPWLDNRGSRAYLLFDAGWLEEWKPRDDGIYGSGGPRPFLWSVGVGLRMPTRGGNLRFDYAVPGGNSIWQGRLHFGLAGRF